MDITHMGDDPVISHSQQTRRAIDDLFLAVLLLRGAASCIVNDGTMHYIFRDPMSSAHGHHYPITDKLLDHLAEGELVYNDYPHKMTSKGYAIIDRLRSDFIRDAREFATKTNGDRVWNIPNTLASVRTMLDKEGVFPTTLGELDPFTYVVDTVSGDEIRCTHGVWSVVPAVRKLESPCWRW